MTAGPALSQMGDEPISELRNADQNEHAATTRRHSSSSATKQLGDSTSLTFLERLSLIALARHTLGIFFLLVTVLLYTASNFLSSTIFADNSYSKPYFVTYIDSSFFVVFLIIPVIKWIWSTHARGGIVSRGRKDATRYSPLAQGGGQAFLIVADARNQTSRSPDSADFGPKDFMPVSIESTKAEDMLNTRETAKLSFEFCMLWFLANYFVAAGLEYTTVASMTVLTATSGIWTLTLGAVMGVEIFSLKKMLGVLGTLTGVVLTSTVDISGETDKNRGLFPHKSKRQIAFGDILALVSAVMCAVYTTVLKKKVGSHFRVNMPLFFGFVGLFNIVALLPGLIIFHVAGLERFELPPTKRILFIVLTNAIISLISDICWAYSMLLTSPLVVTVGLSLTIPLSLVGQIIINHQIASFLYWAGAAIVFVSFVFINYETKKETELNQKLLQRSSEGTRRHSSYNSTVEALL